MQGRVFPGGDVEHESARGDVPEPRLYPPHRDEHGSIGPERERLDVMADPRPMLRIRLFWRSKHRHDAAAVAHGQLPGRGIWFLAIGDPRLAAEGQALDPVVARREGRIASSIRQRPDGDGPLRVADGQHPAVGGQRQGNSLMRRDRSSRTTAPVAASQTTISTRRSVLGRVRSLLGFARLPERRRATRWA